MERGFVVRSLGADDWQIYRDLRLRSLSESPDAFARTLDEERQRTRDEWSRRIEQGQDRRWNLPLVADCDGQPAGLAWGRIDRSVPEVAHVFQVWVAPDCRGRGIGRSLVKTIVSWAQENRAQWVELCVTRGNDSATMLYERLGFEPYGELVPLRDGSALMTQSMRLRIDFNGAIDTV